MFKEMIDLQDKLNSKIHPDWRDRQFDWHRAIWIECAELMDHHGWKWWKHQPHNIEQVKLELVDIWHFVMSQLMTYKHRDLEAYFEYAYVKPKKCENFLVSVEKFAKQALKKGPTDARHFFGLCLRVDMSIEELHKQYVFKNVLNEFRQDHGYLDGSYNKRWNGKEDNEILVEIMDDSETVGYDYLYQKLRAEYENIS